VAGRDRNVSPRRAPTRRGARRWADLGGDKDSWLTHTLGVIELLALLLVLPRVAGALRLPFSPAMSALTFPADILAKAAIRYAELFGEIGHAAVQGTLWALVAFASAVVAVVFVLFARFVFAPAVKTLVGVRETAVVERVV
jgi:hypothetical protein